MNPAPGGAGDAKDRGEIGWHLMSQIGVGKAFWASPPSEPYVRFSRIRLSSRWFPHRGRLALFRTVFCVNNPKLAKGAFRASLTPLPGADTMRSARSEASVRAAVEQVGLPPRPLFRF